MPCFFVEHRKHDRWWPARYHDAAPAVRKVAGKLRIVTADGYGPEIRRAPVEINKGHEHLTLDQLHQCYSPDGRFFHV
ncbi:hypothetical protein ACRARG_12720 [Pseudooceanicola sp. C21-150M6]|uniref:hypothetical protein n=1 Tax=Pseudooceanicola sp. C21-150M6 TaxID=3434355 RepID=UPI003D7F4511